MGTWLAQWHNRLTGWLGNRHRPLSSAERLQKAVADALRAIRGSEPSQEAVRAIIAQDRLLGEWHDKAREPDVLIPESAVSREGQHHIEELNRRRLGYLVVFAQPYVALLLDKLSQASDPLVSVVFQAHEEPSAHLPLLERGRGLAFSLQFYPDHGDAILTPFFNALTCVSSKAIDFAVRHRVPVVPLWTQMTRLGEFVFQVGAPLEEDSVESLAVSLVDHFMERIRREPEQMDWSAACWQPPAKRWLTSRRAARLVLSSGTKLEQLEPFSILVRVPDGLRDACLAIPAVRALKRGRPDVVLTVLADRSARPLWTALAACDAFLAVGDAPASNGSYQLGIVLSNADTAAVELCEHAIGRLVGMENHQQAKWFDDVLPMPHKLGPPEHGQRTYLRVAHRLGAEVQSDESLWVSLEKMTKDSAGGAPSCIGIAPGSKEGKSYQWPLERFEAFIRSHPDEAQFQWRIFLTGSDEVELTFWKSLADANSSLQLSVESSSSEIDVAAMMDRLLQCDVLIANDNDWLHLGAVMGLRTVGIYGPSDPVQTAPWSSSTKIVYTHVECHPCFLPECPLDHRCLQQVETEDVVEAFQTLVCKPD